METKPQKRRLEQPTGREGIFLYLWLIACLGWLGSRDDHSAPLTLAVIGPITLIAFVAAKANNLACRRRLEQRARKILAPPGYARCPGRLVYFEVDPRDRSEGYDLGLVQVGAEGLAYCGDSVSFWLPKGAIRAVRTEPGKGSGPSAFARLLVNWVDEAGQQQTLVLRPYSARDGIESLSVARAMQHALEMAKGSVEWLPDSTRVPTLHGESVRMVRPDADGAVRSVGVHGRG